MKLMDLQPAHVGHLVAVTLGTPSTGAVLVGPLDSYELQRKDDQPHYAWLHIGGRGHEFTGERLHLSTIEVVVR